MEIRTKAQIGNVRAYVHRVSKCLWSLINIGRYPAGIGVHKLCKGLLSNSLRTADWRSDSRPFLHQTSRKSLLCRESGQRWLPPAHRQLPADYTLTSSTTSNAPKGHTFAQIPQPEQPAPISRYASMSSSAPSGHTDTQHPQYPQSERRTVVRFPDLFRDISVILCFFRTGHFFVSPVSSLTRSSGTIIAGTVSSNRIRKRIPATPGVERTPRVPLGMFMTFTCPGSCVFLPDLLTIDRPAVVSTERNKVAFRRCIVDTAPLDTSDIVIVAVHEMHRTDKERVPMKFSKHVEVLVNDHLYDQLPEPGLAPLLPFPERYVELL